MANKQPLTKEDIQAIAQELDKLQQAQKSSGQTLQHERTNALKCEREKSANKSPSNSKSADNSQHIKSIGNWLLILIWAIVFIVLTIKLAPYL